MSAFRLTVAWVLFATCGLSSGCAVTHKSASYDSGSRMPWFGLELARPQRAPAPETHRIRLEGSIPLEPETARLTKPKKLVVKRSSKKDHAEKPSAIAIPRTDTATAAAMQPAALEVTDRDEPRLIEF